MSTENISFEGRNIAVTGGASGIGLAVASGLARRGAAVYVADIAEEAPSELKGQTGIHFFKGLDVSSRAACKTFLDAIPGRLDGVVNCAGICPLEGKMATDDIYERVMAVNVRGTWNVGTEAIARMSQQETRTTEGLVRGSERNLPVGHIVNIGSGAGMHGVSNLAAYSASKHAVVGLTRSWAKDWPSLRINAVSPGATNTPLAMGTSSEEASDQTSKSARAIQFGSRIPLGRMAHATDIADMVVLMLTDSCSFVTGQIIPVNGGSD